MKSLAFAFAAVLATTTTASAVSLSVVQNPDPKVSHRSFTVQATGVGISTLAKFTINDADLPSRMRSVGQTSTNSAWTGDGTAGGPNDSYIMFGDQLVCDAPGHRDGARITTETVYPRSPISFGTLSNYDSAYDTWDAYVKTGTDFLDETRTVDLLHLVLEQGYDTIVNVTLLTATGPDYQTITEYNLSVPIYAPMDGDTDKDGDVDTTDLGNFGAGWFHSAPPSWQKGDFDADGDVDTVDLGLFGVGWGLWPKPNGSEGTAPVPEPGMVVMLVLGALCLAGYRLRG